MIIEEEDEEEAMGTTGQKVFHMYSGLDGSGEGGEENEVFTSQEYIKGPPAIDPEQLKSEIVSELKGLDFFATAQMVSEVQ